MTNTLNSEILAASKPVAVMDRAKLATAVAIASLVVARRNTVPILDNLKIMGTGEALTVTGNDCDCEIAVTMSGAADARLATTIPAHRLKDLLAKAKASELASIDQEDGHASVDLGGVKFRLQTLPVEDFPELTAPSDGAHFEVPASEFMEAIDRTRFAISTDPKRYYLQGLFLELADTNAATSAPLRAVACDGHRLAYFDMTGAPVEVMEWAKASTFQNSGVIVPSGTVDALCKAVAILKRAKALPEFIGLTVSPARMRLELGPVVITSKLIDGTFPDYRRVTPQTNDKRLAINVASLKTGAEQVQLISDERGKGIKLTLADDSCKLSVVNVDAGTAETEIRAGYSSEPMEIGFNASYLIDMCEQITSDDVEIDFNDHGSPTVFRDPGDARWLGVLMPVRV